MNKEDYLEFLEENQKLREERLEGQEFIEKPKGWLVDKEYTNPDEVISDLLYITAEYEKRRLDATELDQYFYKRKWLQDQLNKFYADEFLLVDSFEKIQKVFKYNPEAEGIVSKIADDLNCYVVLRKGDRYFAEVGDSIIELGNGPYVSLLEEDE